ncbi:MAG: hypothetical protein IKM67_05265 [Clostridia bacterium]|nr:hypothetical protein [Clostridia bacterium]
MTNIGVLLIVLLCSIILMLCCVVLAFKIRAFREEANYIKLEINRSFEEDERKYWQRRLKKHYAKLNPFRKKKEK